MPGENPVQVLAAIPSASELPQSGGTDIYSTATLIDENNEQQVAALKQALSNSHDQLGGQATIVQVLDPANQDAVAQQVFAQHAVDGNEGFTIQVNS